jgi:hypothetical protein
MNKNEELYWGDRERIKRSKEIRTFSQETFKKNHMEK